MPLAGTFDVLDFGETLGLLARRTATGRLQVRTSTMHGVIWVAEGQAASAEVGTHEEDEIQHRWQDHIEDICFDALRSPKGSFEFLPEEHAAVPAGPRIKLEDILAGGRHRVEMWESVEPVIRSFEAVPHLADTLDSDSLTLDRNSWKILASVDGRRNMNALSRRVGIRVLDLCVALKPLIECGGVALEHPESWAKSLPKVRLDSEMSGGPSQVLPTELPEGEEQVRVFNGGNGNGNGTASSPDAMVDGPGFDGPGVDAAGETFDGPGPMEPSGNGGVGAEAGLGDAPDGGGSPSSGPRRALLRSRSKRPAESTNP